MNGTEVWEKREVNRDPNSQYKDAVVVSRFWRLVNIGSRDSCWLWGGYADDDGYGLFVWHGKRKPAHELALSFSTGELRHPDLDTCHSCDTPLCCNPAHLRFDTRKSNVADMYERGRENNPARLSDEEVRLIRERRSLGARQSDLARQFGVNDSYISMLTRGSRRPEAGGPLTTKRIYSRG